MPINTSFERPVSSKNKDLFVLYEDKNGEPVKVGSVTEITCDNPNKITGISEDVPTFQS